MREDETKAQYNPQAEAGCLPPGDLRARNESGHVAAFDSSISDVMRLEQRKLDSKEEFMIAGVKLHGKDFFNYLGLLGSSRELSLAKTKIEEAVMWAVKHITR